jgi:hypothetical protein
MGLPLLAVERRWACPNCDHTDVTYESAPHTRFHPCRGLAGLTAPMVPAGTKCKVTVQERDDYINGDMVQTDGNGRPVMSVITERADGCDVAVYAPCATASGRS